MSISVIIPLYNKQDTIQRAILSVLKQDYTNFELIVVDDGSTDESLCKAEGITDKRIRIITQPNAGVSAARNSGIRHATHEYVAFLDADDEWLPRYLSTIYHLIVKYQNCSVFATSYYHQYPDGSRRLPRIRNIAEYWEGVLDNYFDIVSRSDPPLCASVVAVKKTAIKAIHGFPVGIKGGEDLLTWARLAARYPIAYANIPWAIFYRHETALDRPPRIEVMHDKVAEGLTEILEACEGRERKYIKRYIGLWYKSKTSICLQRKDRRAAFIQIRKSIQWYWRDYKKYIYLLLTMLPDKICTYLFFKKKSF